MDSGTVDILGVKEKIKCEVQKFDLSAHSDHDELVSFIRACGPKNVVLCHSDNRELLAKDLESEFNVFLPKSGEQIDI
ncbi:MAG: hypothetical protein FJ151_03905 [Euryarchaeota archaeon]|nr:hypothetical protein [Euryarchaeota archaeon]